MLIGINGPHVSISGAVFAESFYSQRLMDSMFIGPRGEEDLNDAVVRVAVFIRAIERARETLDEYYEALGTGSSSTDKPSPTKQKTAVGNAALDYRFIGPHFSQFMNDGELFTLTYKKRFNPDRSNTSIFLAEATGETRKEPLEVVVKFSKNYGKAGHELLANAKPKALAPKLYYCKKEECVGNLWVIVMEFVPDTVFKMHRKDSARQDIKAALELLHAHGLVFGDLRESNFTCTPEGVKLLDFDWCGEEGKALYPPTINLNRGGELDINWHPQVNRGTLIKKEHDLYMLDVLQL